MNREMKYSRVQWIGEIPEGWSIKPIKQILQERKEINNPVKTDFILSLTMDKGVIPYNEKIGGGNKAKEDLSAYKLAYPKDIVLNSMNVIAGSVGLSKYFGCVSPVYYMLYPRSLENKVEYFNYIFQSSIFQKSLMGLGNGIMMKESSTGNLNTIRMRIPMSKLNTVEIPIPSEMEQEKIANYLDKKISEIDNAISKTKESVEEYKKYKQSLITETVTKGLNKDVEMKDSRIDWIGKIPKCWSIKPLRYLGDLQNGISKGGEFFGQGYPFVSYSDVYKNLTIPSNIPGKIESNEDERKRYSVEEGDVFFTRTSETIEEIGFTSVCLETVNDATFAGFLIRCRVNNKILNKNYSKYYFRSTIHRSFFVKEMNLVTRASLSQELLKKLPVLIPTLKEQREIADYLDKKCLEIDNLISKKEQLTKELEDYKKSLIYETVTGKRVI